MLYNIQTIIFFPEILLTILTLILLIVGLFQKENSFKNICNLSSISLILILFTIYTNNDLDLKIYKNFFTNSDFIQFFKFLIIIGSLSTIKK